MHIFDYFINDNVVILINNIFKTAWLLESFKKFLKERFVLRISCEKKQNRILIFPLCPDFWVILCVCVCVCVCVFLNKKYKILVIEYIYWS